MGLEKPLPELVAAAGLEVLRERSGLIMWTILRKDKNQLRGRASSEKSADAMENSVPFFCAY